MRDQARYDYTPVTEREYDLPNDANVAVWIAPNVEYFKIDVPSTAIYPDAAEFQPDVLNHGWRDYGARVGIWRLLDVLDAHDVTPTVSLNAEVCDHQPAVVEGLVEAGAEFMCHGQSNSQLHVGMEYEEERALIEAARQAYDERGWLDPETVHNLEERGVSRGELYEIFALHGMKMFSSFVNHIATPEIDAPLKPTENRLDNVPEKPSTLEMRRLVLG